MRTQLTRFVAQNFSWNDSIGFCYQKNIRYSESVEKFFVPKISVRKLCAFWLVLANQIAVSMSAVKTRRCECRNIGVVGAEFVSALDAVDVATGGDVFTGKRAEFRFDMIFYSLWIAIIKYWHRCSTDVSPQHTERWMPLAIRSDVGADSTGYPMRLDMRRYDTVKCKKSPWQTVNKIQKSIFLFLNVYFDKNFVRKLHCRLCTSETFNLFKF